MAASRCPECGKRSGEERIKRSYKDTPGGMHVFEEKGWHCWSCDAEWGFVYLREGRAFIAELFGQICDFCSDEEPRHVFQSKPYVTDSLPGLPEQHFDSRWAACDTCAVLIRKGDRQAIAMRSAKKYKSNYGLSVSYLYPRILEMQKGFWEGLED